jgi:glycosyl hydrolase family 25
MTTYGWDQSHYDEPMKSRDGIDYVTHKITEGDHWYEDSEYKSAIDAASAFGVSILGSYHVQHGSRSVSNQADWWVSRVNALTPWWHDHYCWTWQIDAEKFSYMTAPTIDEVNALGDAIVARAKCSPERVIAYAPAWLYGSNLRRLRYALWQSNYGSNPVGPYRSVYPGDLSTRWAAPISPLILQYGSNTIIAGQTTCDANAYRGTLEDLEQALKAIQGGEVTMLRFLFQGFTNTPEDDDKRVHITDGVRYRRQPLAVRADDIYNTALGSKPIVVTPATLYPDWDYTRAVSTLCGMEDREAATTVPATSYSFATSGTVELVPNEGV